MNLDHLKRLCSEATPGPWVNIGGYRVGSMSASIGDLDEGGVFNPHSINHDADGAFIAAAREWVPKLIAVAEAAKAVRPSHCTCDEPCYDCSKEEWALSKALAALESSDE